MILIIGVIHFQKNRIYIKKDRKKPLDLDPYGNLFNNKISYFNECKEILKDFIIKVPNLYKKENYVLDLQNYIDELINSETNTLRKNSCYRNKRCRKYIKIKFFKRSELCIRYTTK